MVSDLDIYYSALALIREHGEKASDVAIKQAKTLLGARNIEGHDIFMRIAIASKLILDKKLPKDALPH